MYYDLIWQSIASEFYCYSQYWSCSFEPRHVSWSLVTQLLVVLFFARVEKLQWFPWTPSELLEVSATFVGPELAKLEAGSWMESMKSNQRHNIDIPWSEWDTHVFFCDIVFKAHAKTVRLRPFYHKLASRQGAFFLHPCWNRHWCNMFFHDAFFSPGARGLDSCTPSTSQNLYGRYMFEPPSGICSSSLIAQAQLACKSRRHPSWYSEISQCLNLDKMHKHIARTTSTWCAHGVAQHKVVMPSGPALKQLA